MLTAKPVRAFSLRGKQILTCRTSEENANLFLGRRLWFYPAEGEPKRIQIEGISTASDFRKGELDFLYSGAEIQQSEIVEGSLLSDALRGRKKPQPQP